MTTDKCFSCKRKDESLLCEICGIGMNGEREYYIRNPITNADRIRTMSDEELASFLWNRDMDILEKVSKTVGLTFRVNKERCASNVLDWLKQEAE